MPMPMIMAPTPDSWTDAGNIQYIEDITTHVDAEQKRVLGEILRRNAESEYLAKRCGLGGATDRAAFRANVPLVKYEDLRPYIRRIADGDASPVLTGPGHPVTELFTSSGTSGGERKMIPNVDDEVDRRHLLEGLFTSVMVQHVPGLETGGALYFLYVSSEGTTPGGLPERTVMTSYYKSRPYEAYPFPRNNASPTAAILCGDVAQSTYAQLLCGLCRRLGVMHVGAAFAVGLVRAIHFLQQHWERLAADIEAGELLNADPSISVTDPAVRAAVREVLRPDPELARFVRAECGKGDWAGIIPRIWPNTKYLGAIVTGSMAQYIPTLNYYSGGLPTASDIYGASEGDFGLNLDPFCDPAEVSYTVMPNMAYFEFLPLSENNDGEDVVEADGDDDDDKEKRLVELARVEAGRAYELVVTTYTGLCRYRMGDVLRVTGFHNAAPVVRFLRRGNVALSVDGEKTDEAELQRAVERASDLLLRAHGAAAVAEYTARACNEAVPGRYVVYWELQSKNGGVVSTAAGDEVMERCCLEMEEALGAAYRRKRAMDGSIGPMEVRVVRPGTFEKLMDHAVSRGTSMSQYKVPRCVSGSPAIVDLLDARVVSSHFSPKSPHWAPEA